jgi:hypothetical protein
MRDVTDKDAMRIFHPFDLPFRLFEVFILFPQLNL